MTTTPQSLGSSPKYTVFDLTKSLSSSKSPYATRIEFYVSPPDEQAIESWMKTSIGQGNYLIRKSNHSVFEVEYFFRNESDMTALFIKWGDSFV